MPRIEKPEASKPSKQRPDAAQKIRQGKSELKDEELTKVSGGQKSPRQFTNIDP